MWGWNPAYTFHGGNTFYYMRLAKQRGCKFVAGRPPVHRFGGGLRRLVDPIKPNTDAAMLAGMAHYIFANKLQDQAFIDKFCPGHGRRHHAGLGQGPGKLQGLHPRQVRRHAQDPGVGGADLRRAGGGHPQAGRHVRPTKPAALKASWAPGRNAYGEQYNRMAAALQAMTGNIGILGGCAEGVGKGWHSEAWPTPTTSTPTSGSPRSSPTAGRTAC
jgi:anaerobic dimethyl sulfoxide reductase subunit A